MLVTPLPAVIDSVFGFSAADESSGLGNSLLPLLSLFSVFSYINQIFFNPINMEPVETLKILP